MKPTIGRIVHFAPPQDCKGKTTPYFYAAIITRAQQSEGTTDEANERNYSIDLATFGPNSLYSQHGIPFSEELRAGHWSWAAKA